jgi:hypothetical protein
MHKRLFLNHAAAAAVMLPVWLGTVESLDLTLLVHAQDQGLVRRIQIQAHDIAEFLDKVLVSTEFKSFDQVRLEEDLSSAGIPQACTPVATPLGFASAPIGNGEARLMCPLTWPCRVPWAAAGCASKAVMLRAGHWSAVTHAGVVAEPRTTTFLAMGCIGNGTATDRWRPGTGAFGFKAAARLGIARVLVEKHAARAR